MHESLDTEGPSLTESFAELLCDGRQALDRGDPKHANAVVERVLLSAGSVDQPVMRIKAQILGAQAAIATQSFEQATSYATEAVRIARTLGTSSLIADGLLVLARVSYAIGDFEQALVELEQVQPLLGGIANEATSFSFHVFVGNVHLAMGQFEAAISVGMVADRLATNLGDLRSQAVAAGNLASYWFSEHERRRKALGAQAGTDALHHALALNEKAMQLASECGAQQLNLAHYSNHGAMLVAAERDQDAAAMFARHRSLANALRQNSTLPAALFAEATLEKRLGNLATANDILREGIEIGEQLQANNDLTDLYELASEIAESEGDLETALRLYKAMYRTRTRSITQVAEQRSLVMGVRLATDRAVHAASSERERAEELRKANKALERHAEKLTKEALEDALTGLANRRQLDLHLAQYHLGASGGSTGTCVAILDVDFFKLVNDRHSHGVGDQVLRQIAALIQASCREGDLAARSGGEEFVLCLHAVDLPLAAAACERVRKAIELFTWSQIAVGLSVTISVGVTALGFHANPDVALAAADSLLYQAKREGRNRVCASSMSAAVAGGPAHRR